MGVNGIAQLQVDGRPTGEHVPLLPRCAEAVQPEAEEDPTGVQVRLHPRWANAGHPLPVRAKALTASPIKLPSPDLSGGEVGFA